MSDVSMDALSVYFKILSFSVVKCWIIISISVPIAISVTVFPCCSSENVFALRSYPYPTYLIT